MINKTVVEFFSDSKTVNVINDDGIKKTEKLVGINDFLNSILISIDKNEVNTYISPLYEDRKGVKLIQCKYYGKNSKIYILFREKGNVPMPVYHRIYANVGIPSLLFAVHVVNNRMDKLYVVATKDTVITNDTLIYRYPFTHVSYTNGSVCTGQNRFTPGIEDNNLKLLYEIPNQFFSMPNAGADYANYADNRNDSHIGVEEKFRELDNKDFDEGLLIKSPFLNYKNFIEKVGGKM